MAPRDVRSLTPAKLAAFYREVGGDLDGTSDAYCCVPPALTMPCLPCLSSALPRDPGLETVRYL